ncbi:ATP-binding cassette domain-containing protein [Verminephrobacter aporrectodeae subsp. tuberculatae]|uniref:ABC transporter ATP-binding protein n=1 Tax=Verminephrobacter aporrectodeae TaxID=1110389 RepID=UPI002242E014|nr:oligopeptide/dipeptide ABC transporter ATP-binding protein [Verminephrobacter aporrectodeae]MCW8165698.1 ATP-binding cassette domain-containing protein [Verminephrobacter aporrectodeae subsp. tuberculatae]MCW8169671.1 ATP-binding cassette domain-containing protein [Verminephrobacter aporrectodeae subsp. tuberculatae]
MSLLQLRNISKRFATAPTLVQRVGAALGRARPPATVHAVSDVSLEIAQGEVLGLVGESGCGKSTLARMAAGIQLASSGQALYRGQPVAVQRGTRVHKSTRQVQMIFQDPYASLNPRHRVERIVGEGAFVHGLIDKPGLRDYVCDCMLRAGIDPAYRLQYPHQFSGGQRQRIGVARALAMQPEFLVCDEAVAALDVSIQAQVLNLFMQLRQDFSLTYLFVSHDLGVVRHLSDRVAVMYLGRLVELAPAEDIFARANHPYTRALLDNMLTLDARRRRFRAIQGEIPSPLDPPSGCAFHPRCPHALPRCKQETPQPQRIAPGHFSACHLNG